MKRYAEGDEDALDAADFRKAWQRLSTALAAPSDGAAEAKGQWDDVAKLGPGQGKEKKKRAILHAWWLK